MVPLENAFVAAAVELNVLPAQVAGLCRAQESKRIAKLFRATQAAGLYRFHLVCTCFFLGDAANLHHDLRHLLLSVCVEAFRKQLINGHVELSKIFGKAF